MKAKHWYDYLWVYAIIYFALGFFNILFAWLGMIDFLLPLFLAIFGGNKFFCNHLCGRGQLFSKLGTDLKCSRCKPTPRWMSSKWFRYGFLIFFLTMFGNMGFQTYLVAAGAASLREAIKLFWTFRVPLLMCDKEAIEVQKILPFLSDTWPLCRIGRAVIRASQSCRQSCNKSQCPACGCRSRRSCTHAPRFSPPFPARGWGSVLQRQGACGQCP